MNKINLLLSHFLCSFPGGHAVAPIILLEPVLGMSIFGDSSVVLTLILVASFSTGVFGQLLLIMTSVFNNQNQLNVYTKIGSVLLLINIILVYNYLSESSIVITGLSSLPFLFFFLKLWVKPL